MAQSKTVITVTKKPKWRTTTDWYIRFALKAAIPERIRLIEDKILKEDDAESKTSLYYFLAREFSSCGMFSEAVDIYKIVANKHPNSPRPLIALSQHYLYCDTNYSKAADICEQAVNIARLHKKYLREALGVSIRINLELKNYISVENSLIEIIDTESRNSNLDVSIESDFLDRIPPGKVSNIVIDQYMKLIANNNEL